MKVCVENSQISGRIKAIPSKSYAHRIAICNFLSGKEPTGNAGEFSSKDIFATEDCLKRVLDGEQVLDCGESGSTLRFLLPLLSARGGEYEFILHGKLANRPNDQLFSVLNSHGVKTVQDKTIKISGKLTSGEYTIRGDVSSQYVSGLLMALPTLEGDSKITLLTPLASKSYVDITLEVLSGYGINIQKLENGYFINGNQKFEGNLLPEGDWSNMAVFLVAGGILGDISVTGLNANSVQGDRKILEILQDAGVKIEVEKDIVKVYKSEIRAFSFDADDTPDLVPIASVLGGCAKGQTVIKKVERLKIKESNRIDSTIKMLASFGINAEYKNDSIIINGNKIKRGVVDSFNDHRIVMAGTIFGSIAEGESQILGAQAVEKSYPTFFRDYKSVGGKVFDDN